MAATALAIHISALQIEHPFLPKTRFLIRPKTTSSKRISLVRASSKPQIGGGGGGGGGADAANEKAALVSQEDLKYLVKLGGGSIAGAAAIKYGSVVFPGITSPNLGQALFMITAPVVVAVLLLIKQSRVD